MVVRRNSYPETKALFSDTLGRDEVVGTPLIVTDDFGFCERVIRRFFGAACICAQVVKTWRKDRVTRVGRRATIGTTRRLLQHTRARVLDNALDVSLRGWYPLFQQEAVKRALVVLSGGWTSLT